MTFPVGTEHMANTDDIHNYTLTVYCEEGSEFADGTALYIALCNSAGMWERAPDIFCQGKCTNIFNIP